MNSVSASSAIPFLRLRQVSTQKQRGSERSARGQLEGTVCSLQLFCITSPHPRICSRTCAAPQS